jgi:GNAT superfamily N-acetyltransferase
MSSTPVIRQAHPRDRDGVVATVAAAFARDPGWAFIFGEEYERLAADFAGALFDVRVAGGNVWATDDLAGVAMWNPPGVGDDVVEAGTEDDEMGADDEIGTGYAKKVWGRYRAIAGEEAWNRLASYNDAIAAVAPDEPHWYLGVLATHPERQRAGLASALLRPVLGEADRVGVACCLETSTVSNRRFYERRGFEQASEIVLPGGPDTWWLRRGPRGMAGM